MDLYMKIMSVMVVVICWCYMFILAILLLLLFKKVDYDCIIYDNSKSGATNLLKILCLMVLIKSQIFTFYENLIRSIKLIDEKIYKGLVIYFNKMPEANQ